MEADNKISTPLVTIVCTVYNHSKYLRKCLDGFVMQQTDFPFIALVHDDCSTDDSLSIIKEYAEKYPDIIVPLIETENLYSKHDGSLMRAIDKHITSPYVAYCEGDDYWTHPKKLQIQVEYMEKHPKCSLCFHNVNVLTEGSSTQHAVYNHLYEGIFYGDDIIRKWTVPTCSAMMRSADYLQRPYNKDFAVGDNVMWLNSLKSGYAYCFDNKMATYRRLQCGWTLAEFGGSKDKVAAGYEKQIRHLRLLKHYFPGVADNGIHDSLVVYYARLTVIYGLKFNSGFKECLSQGIKLGKGKYITTLFKTIAFYIKIRINRIFRKSLQKNVR